ncbi:mannose-6-phosphate isomerase [Mycena floridula]|nr:mannose-6-phosphate isomerase [Mycena floridula]
MSSQPVFRITPTTQQYDWGKIGSNSKVAQLASASRIPGFVLESKPYAELWMGTHSTSPSTLGNQSLSSHLKAHPVLIGDEVSAKFPSASEGNLPFLFKVLSIEKALSIQTHPDKKTAEFLHRTLPKIYKDDNHKPELALALTPFEALCGFLPLPEIAEYLTTVPELATLIPSSVQTGFLSLSNSSTPDGAEEKAALRDLFSALMNTEEAVFKEQLKVLVARYASTNELKTGSIEELVLRLDTQFPGDIGVFCAFMLNRVKLQPGEAIFLGAGEPHAYVSGDIIECMANSDNVIRAGLTPKLRDIPNLIDGLTYIAAQGSKHRVTPTPFGSSGFSTLYDPPIPEFSVVQVRLEAGAKETHPGVKGPSLLIVTDGAGILGWSSGSLEIGLGDVLFVGADSEVDFISEAGLTLYRAFVEAK